MAVLGQGTGGQNHKESLSEPQLILRAVRSHQGALSKGGEQWPEMVLFGWDACLANSQKLRDIR